MADIKMKFPVMPAFTTALLKCVALNYLQSWTKYMAKMAFYSPSPISMLFLPIHMFLHEDFSENRNIDIGGGTSIPKN